MSIRPEHLFLHVGMPKAASTSLQRWFSAHREALLEQGVWFPKDPKPGGSMGHPTLLKQVRKGTTSLPVLSEILENVQAPNILLSREGFYGLPLIPRCNLAPFRDQTRHIDQKTIVVVTRDPKSWMRSRYRQRVFRDRVNHVPKHLASLSFEEFSQLDRHRQMVDYDVSLPKIKAAYGADHLLRLQLEDKDWFKTLLTHIGLGALAHLELGHANRGHEDWMTEVMLQVNRRYRRQQRRLPWLAALQYFRPTEHGHLIEAAENYTRQDLQNLDLDIIAATRAAKGGSVPAAFDQALTEFEAFLHAGLPEDTREDGPKETQ